MKEINEKSLFHVDSSADSTNNKADEASSVIEYPGIYPGTAAAALTDSNFELQNSVLCMKWNVSGKNISLDQFTDKVANSKVSMSTVNLFSLTMEDGTVITPADSKIAMISSPILTSLTGNPTATRLSERENGKRISATYRYHSELLSFEVVWSAILRDGNCNIQQRFDINPVIGNFNLKYVKLIDVTLPGAYVIGVDNGQTVIAGNVFMGIENPMSTAMIEGSNVGVQVEKASEVIANGSTITYTQSIGVVPEGQLRRGFLYYIERERIHYRRPYLTYVSWYDLVAGPGGGHNDLNCLNRINTIGTEMAAKRGVKWDGFLWDDNWDDYDSSPVWNVSSTMFPDKFENIKSAAAGYGANLGIWFSPFGGYGSNINRAKANPTMEQTNNNFIFSGPNYNTAVRNMSYDMVDNQRVNIIKIDGIGGGLYQNGPNSSNRKDYEALLKYLLDMRERKPDLFLYCTVGTWSSPYWLWYADAIYRDDSDQPYKLTGNYRQQLISGRDNAIYNYNVKQNILHPISELMSHGFVFSKSTINGTPADTNLMDTSNQKEIKDDMRWYFASGFSLQEMYLAVPAIGSNEFFWDNIARYAKWARANNCLLADSHMIGYPSNDSVYGYGSWSPKKAILALRNPSSTAKTYSIDPQIVFELPAGVHQSYLFTEIDGLVDSFIASTSTQYTVTLQAYSVLAFEAIPAKCEN